jgi:signal transduction histidine kinase
MNESPESLEPLAALAAHLSKQRDAILQAWREAVDEDPELTTASSVSRAQFNDHIPKVLDAFERQLSARGSVANAMAIADERQGAAEHGLHRWQQGYDQRETMREWGHLHVCLLDAVERFGAAHPHLDTGVMAHARRELVRLCNAGVCESASRYMWLLRAEAASRVRELEQGLEQVMLLDKQRAEAWREAAHDLRGSVSVISSAAAILNRDNVPDPTRSQYSRMLRTGVVSLHELLSDLMSLARLEAGHDQRSVASFDAAASMREFCDSMRPLAAERGLFLRCEGPESLAVEGDAAKVRRIAQNLVLNALHATDQGGVTVMWQSGEGLEPKHWVLCVQDTGPGFKGESAPPLARVLKEATQESQDLDPQAKTAVETMSEQQPRPVGAITTSRSPQESAGEGIGLSIVKRLCELLDAGLELESAAGQGSTFRISFPIRYPK